MRDPYLSRFTACGDSMILAWNAYIFAIRSRAVSSYRAARAPPRPRARAPGAHTPTRPHAHTPTATAQSPQRRAAAGGASPQAPVRRAAAPRGGRRRPAARGARRPRVKHGVKRNRHHNQYGTVHTSHDGRHRPEVLTPSTAPHDGGSPGLPVTILQDRAKPRERRWASSAADRRAARLPVDRPPLPMTSWRTGGGLVHKRGTPTCKRTPTSRRLREGGV